MTKQVNPEFVHYTLEKLKEIASEMAGTPEGVAFGLELVRLEQVDAERAARLMAVFSAFVTEHAKRVAVQFYRMGEASGLAEARQQLEKRQARTHTPRQGPRLQ